MRNKSCRNCGEPLEDAFDACWRCGTYRSLEDRVEQSLPNRDDPIDSGEPDSGVQTSTPINTPGAPEHDSPRVLLGFFGPITFVILLAIASVAYRDVWPLFAYRPTSAVIDSTSIEERAGRRGNRYIPRVHYTYAVAGHTYHGTRVTPADLKGKRAWADNLLQVYVPGTEVLAYYDPDQPEYAFLRRSLGRFVSMLAFAMVWIGLATWSIVTEFRRERRLRSA